MRDPRWILQRPVCGVSARSMVADTGGSVVFE